MCADLRMALIHPDDLIHQLFQYFRGDRLMGVLLDFSVILNILMEHLLKVTDVIF